MLGSLFPGTDESIIRGLEAYILYQTNYIESLKKQIIKQKAIIKTLKENEQ